MTLPVTQISGSLWVTPFLVGMHEDSGRGEEESILVLLQIKNNNLNIFFIAFDLLLIITVREVGKHGLRLVFGN
jgi:hypothetical protein